MLELTGIVDIQMLTSERTNQASMLKYKDWSEISQALMRNLASL